MREAAQKLSSFVGSARRTVTASYGLRPPLAAMSNTRPHKASLNTAGLSC
jgi:hypothetical protein